MKIKIEKSVTVITAAVGQPTLIHCTDSVQKQTYGNVKHWIVIDGLRNWNHVMNNSVMEQTSDVLFTSVPENTGGAGFYGHRIYAAYPHLVNSDYVCFLDEDNWYEPDHVESLVNTIEENDYVMAYSLRKIYKEDSTFLDFDNCESLGLWPVMESNIHLVDTSSWCFRREFLIKVCQHWHWGWGGDRNFLYNAVHSSIDHHLINETYDNGKWGTSGKHTLCYRLGDDEKVKKMYGGYDFFEKGNKLTKDIYGDYPWLT